MGPPANHHDLIEPGIERLDQPSKFFHALVCRHYDFSLKIAASARRRISWA